MNSLVGIWVGGLIAVGGMGLGAVPHDRPATPRPGGPVVTAPEVRTSVDDEGHVYAQLLSAGVDGIVCEYVGARLTAQRPGRDGVVRSCPAAPPAQDVTWPPDGGEPLPVDPADPDIPACRAVGGVPMPPQLGGGGGEGAPVDFCMIGGHLWGPGGPTGAPWGTTVVDATQCGLLGGSLHAVDPERPVGYDCVWRGSDVPVASTPRR